jgi:ribosomal protein L17
MNGWHGSVHSARNTQQRTAVVPQLTQQIVRYDNCTATIKDASWNEWLVWPAGVITHAKKAHCCSTTARSRLVHDNCTAIIKDVQLE